MDFALWPIVLRWDLVAAFRPGEPPDREGPFRTLRQHEWATAGVPVHVRDSGHAAGKVVLYSVLNVEAAICARCGDEAAAVAFAKAADRLERSQHFARLRELLSQLRSSEVSSCAAGEIDPASVMTEALTRLALETETVRRQRRFAKYALHTRLGLISDVAAHHVVLTSKDEPSIAVPRQLARAAHRERIGECLGVINSPVDDRELLVRALPGIDLRPARRARYSPFERVKGFERVSAADAAYLRGTPAPLTITMPITIGR
jgi:hypothetical protein